MNTNEANFSSTFNMSVIVLGEHIWTCCSRKSTFQKKQAKKKKKKTGKINETMKQIRTNE